MAVLVALALAFMPGAAQAAPPANDNFANAELVNGAAVTVNGNLTDSTLQPGEPAAAFGGIFNGSVWYQWTAPSSGQVQLSATGTSTGVGIYTGSAVNALTAVSQSFSPITATVTAGTTYYLAAAKNSSTPVGAFTLTLNLQVAGDVPNDDFADAASIDGDTLVSVNGTLLGATVEPGDPGSGFGFTKSVWYTWTAPRSGLVEIGLNSNLALGVYTGTALGALTVVQQNFTRVSFAASAGTTYRIGVAGGTNAASFNLQLNRPGPPANDNFGNALSQGGQTFNLLADNRNATRESGEPDHAGSSDESTIWFNWTNPASSSRSVVLTSCGLINSGSVATAVYTGSALDSLTEVASGGCRAVFTAVPGQTYRIAVATTVDESAEFQLHLRDGHPPANDSFANAEVLAGNEIGITRPIEDATVEAGEPQHGGSGDRETVWFKWTAPVTGSAVMSASSAQLFVYEGNALNSLTEVTGGDSEIQFPATQGVEYSIVAYSASIGGSSSFDLTLGVFEPPPNDDFADATDLSGGPTAAVSGDLRGASRETNESTHYFPGPASVWYSWTAPHSGPSRIDACGEYDRLSGVAAYTGSSVDSLTPVASGSCQFDFTATMGTTYRIAVATTIAKAGPFRLWIDLPEAPGNDNFANAKPISGVDITENGNLNDSTLEPTEPVQRFNPGFFTGTVWYRWVAPGNGRLEVNVGRPDAAVGAYTGTTPGNLVQVGSAGFTFARFDYTAGTTYWIAVARTGASISRFAMSLVYIDNQPPDTFIDSGPTGQVNSNQATFTFHGTPGDTAKVQCVIDTGAFVDCASPKTFTGLSEGLHTVFFKAVDAAGNEDISPATADFTVDTVAPVVSIHSGPSGTTNTSTAAFGFAANEPGVSFECRLDTEPFQSCVNPKSFASLSAGAHTFTVRGTDAAGNQSAAPVTRTWTYQPDSPTTTIAGTVPVGGSISTDPGGAGPTPAAPATAAITVPGGGEVTVTQQPADVQAPAGFRVIGQQFTIEAPPATVEEPLVLEFRIDESVLPEDYLPEELTMLRDGVAITECTSSDGTATPDPCISGVDVLEDGDVVITVLSSHASDWNVAVVKLTRACLDARAAVTASNKKLAAAKAKSKTAAKKLAKATKKLRKTKRSHNRRKIKRAKKSVAAAKAAGKRSLKAVKTARARVAKAEKQATTICAT